MLLRPQEREVTAYLRVTTRSFSTSSTTTLSSRSNQPRARRMSFSVFALVAFLSSLVVNLPFSLSADQILPAVSPTFCTIKIFSCVINVIGVIFFIRCKSNASVKDKCVK